jgi:hypothetical protein
MKRKSARGARFSFVTCLLGDFPGSDLVGGGGLDVERPDYLFSKQLPIAQSQPFRVLQAPVSALVLFTDFQLQNRIPRQRTYGRYFERLTGLRET